MLLTEILSIRNAPSSIRFGLRSFYCEYKSEQMNLEDTSKKRNWSTQKQSHIYFIQKNLNVFELMLKYNTCKKQEQLRLLTLCTVTTFIRYRSQLCMMPSSVFCKTVYKRQIHFIS